MVPEHACSTKLPASSATTSGAGAEAPTVSQTLVGGYSGEVVAPQTTGVQRQGVAHMRVREHAPLHPPRARAVGGVHSACVCLNFALSSPPMPVEPQETAAPRPA